MFTTTLMSEGLNRVQYGQAFLGVDGSRLKVRIKVTLGHKAITDPSIPIRAGITIDGDLGGDGESEPRYVGAPKSTKLCPCRHVMREDRGHCNDLHWHARQ